MKKANFLTLLVSVLVPLAGIIFYFIYRKKVENPNDYIFASVLGFGSKLIDVLYTNGYITIQF